MTLIWKRFKPVKADGVVDEGDLPDDGDGEEGLGGGGGGGPEEQTRKREMRLLKNREAARECRNKKKEYIKCLENRVGKFLKSKPHI